jgi:hypothetical protein
MDWLALVVPTLRLLNVNAVGEKPIPDVTPVPDSVIDCGLPLALSVMATLEGLLPVVVG